MSIVKVTADLNLSDVDIDDLYKELHERLDSGDISENDIASEFDIQTEDDSEVGDFNDYELLSEVGSRVDGGSIDDSDLECHGLMKFGESIKTNSIMEELKFKTLHEAFDKYSLEELENRLK